MEISMQLIHQETIIKKKFLKYSKAQFKVYNKLSHNFYFKNTFNFFIELIISKVTQLEIVFEKLENTIRMIKENYSIIIEDNTEKQNIKLNSVMKVLAIITTIYAPLNIIPNLFGMNVKVPWQDVETTWPFFGILMFSLGLVIVELFVFKKLKWLED
jgi:Mg2+ and Co2+ transporter CorA